MTFLKKFGVVVQKIATAASQFIPLLAVFTPLIPAAEQPTVARVTDKLDQAITVLVTAEQMFAAAGVAKSGSDKLKAATPFIAALLKNSELLAGKSVQNEQLFETASSQLTSALADVLNSFGE